MLVSVLQVSGVNVVLKGSLGILVTLPRQVTRWVQYQTHILKAWALGWRRTVEAPRYQLPQLGTIVWIPPTLRLVPRVMQARGLS